MFSFSSRTPADNTRASQSVYLSQRNEFVTSTLPTAGYNFILDVVNATASSSTSTNVTIPISSSSNPIYPSDYTSIFESFDGVDSYNNLFSQQPFSDSERDSIVNSIKNSVADAGYTVTIENDTFDVSWNLASENNE